MVQKNGIVIRENYDPDGNLKSIYQVKWRDNEIKSSYYCEISKFNLFFFILAYLFIIILFIASLIYHHAPRPGLLQESCDKRSCLFELNLKCINKTCLCADNYFYLKKCVAYKNYMEKCNLKTICMKNTSLTCMDGVCKCKDTKYWTGDKCTNKGTYGSTCNSDSQCLDQSILICDTENNKCTCSSDRFWDGFGCVLLRTYNEFCTSGKQCATKKNLICLNGKCLCDDSSYYDLNSLICTKKHLEYEYCIASYQCFTPMNCTNSSLCRCGNYQYHDLTNLICLPQKTINQSCLVTNECRIDKNLECINRMCQCNSMYPTWSFGYNKCIIPLNYSETCYSNSDCDQSNKLLICNNGTNNCTCPLTLTNGKCDCLKVINNEYYFDGSGCVISSSYGQSCSLNYMCKVLTEGTLCSGSICICPLLQYFKTSIKKCQNQVLNNIACPQGNECRTDLGLICQSGTCFCNSTYQFWNGSNCYNYLSYNQGSCTNDTECAGTLICRTNSTSNSCACPLTITINKCDCPHPVIGAEYFWNGNDCVIASNYTKSCANNYECKSLEQSTECLNNMCQCNASEVFSNGKCVVCKNGWTKYDKKCYNFFHNTVNNIAINPSTLSIGIACNDSNAKLAILNTTLQSIFNSAYLHTNSDYYVDAYYSSSSGNVKSFDGSYIYDNTYLCTRPVTKQCFHTTKSGPVSCLKETECFINKSVACEYGE